jgi:hypothetical protein
MGAGCIAVTSSVIVAPNGTVPTKVLTTVRAGMIGKLVAALVGQGVVEMASLSLVQSHCVLLLPGLGEKKKMAQRSPWPSQKNGIRN